MREYLTPDVVEKFWQRVAKRGPDDCWEWQGSLNDCGYGRLRLSGKIRKNLTAHRIAYVLAYGEVPADKPLVCQTCDNPPCCNPRHLFAGTNLDNARDKVEKGRWRGNPRTKRGEEAPKAKLTAPQVMHLRRLYANTLATMEELGQVFGISGAAVSNVVQGKSWSHLPTIPVPDWKRKLARKRPGNGSKPGTRRPSRVVFTPEQVEMLRDAYARGETYRSIADRYEASAMVVYDAVNSRGAYRQ